jgi:alpha-glucosidase
MADLTRPKTTRGARVGAALAGAAGLLVAGPGHEASASPSPIARIAGAGSRTTLAIPTASMAVGGSPVGLAVADARGRVVLATARGDRVRGGVPYAGLSFTVGPEPELRYPELPGQSGLNPPADGPTRRYVARRVVSTASSGRALRVVFATDDPAGRRIVLHGAPGPAGTVRLQATVTGARGARGVTAVAAAFASDPREAFHGFGGRRESTDLRGRSFQNWVQDYRFPDVRTGYYAPQASFISSRDYGVFLDTDRIARWRLGSDTPWAWRVSVAGTSMRLVVAPGRPAEAMRALTAITARHRVAPAWSLGSTLSRARGVLADKGDVYRRKVQADVARLERERLPVSVYAFEGWAALPRSFVKDAIARLRARRIRTLLYLRSFVANDSAGTEPPGLFATAIAKGYVARTASGAPYLFPSPFPGGQAAVIDFTNPAARRWWSRRVANLLDTGAEGFMNDFGEQVLPAMHFADGTTGSTTHNRYPVLQARATRAAVDAWERRHPGRRVYFFQRSGYSGRPGSPAYESAEFPGDETVDWQPATGLPSVVPDMLNRAVTGAPGFTIDIGGYAQFTREKPILPPPSAELFTRWSQATALTPFFRVHNSGLDGARMPWDFDRATERAWAAAARLHVLAGPLILRLWRSFTRTGLPMTRPLWLVDPAGARGPRGNDEWLLGDDLLVAPVLREGARSRPVRLPPGCWRLHGSGPQLPGARTVTAAAPLSELPWYARCGTRPLR